MAAVQWSAPTNFPTKALVSRDDYDYITGMAIIPSAHSLGARCACACARVSPKSTSTGHKLRPPPPPPDRPKLGAQPVFKGGFNCGRRSRRQERAGGGGSGGVQMTYIIVGGGIGCFLYFLSYLHIYIYIYAIIYICTRAKDTYYMPETAT